MRKTVNLVAALLFGAALATAQSTTTIDANTQIRNLSTGFNPLSFGGKVNLYTYDNYALIQRLINNANLTGTCAVYLPAGIWYVSRGLDIPSCVELQGVGFGQGTLFGGPKLGTVVQAQTAFTGPSGYPSNFMLYVDGSPSVGAESDTYNVNVHGITFDCAGVTSCSGFYIGHANENVSVYDSMFANFSDFGEYHCGAGLGGAIWLHCGDQGSGPYFNNQLVSYGSWVTSSTYPLVIMSSLGDRPWSNYTINTTPGPVSAALVQGLGLSLSHIHVENSANGVVLGPTSGLCAALPGGAKCNGLQVSSVNQISLGPTGSGYAIINQSSQSVSISETFSDGQTTALIQDQHNSVTVPNSYNGQYYIQDSGDCFAVEYCVHLNAPIFATANETLQSQVPTLTLRDTSTGLFPYVAISETAAGDLSIGGSGGDRNILFNDGNAVLALRSAASVVYNGANVQSPLNANSGAAGPINALFGSNIYWDTSGAGTFRFGNIGGGGYAAGFGGQSGGFGLSVSSASQPGTLTPAQFFTNTSLWAKENGHILMAPPGSGGAYAASDSGQELTVIGGINGTLTGTATGFTTTPTPCGAGYAVNGITSTGNGNGGGGCLPVDRQWVSAGSCSTAGTAAAKCTTTLTWGSAYASTAYSATCTLIEPVTGAPYLEGIAKANGSVTVTISNGQGSQAVVSSANSIECTAHAVP